MLFFIDPSDHVQAICPYICASICDNEEWTDAYVVVETRATLEGLNIYFKAFSPRMTGFLEVFLPSMKGQNGGQFFNFVFLHLDRSVVSVG